MPSAAGGGTRTGVRNSETAAIRVHGEGYTIRNIRDVDMGAVFVASLISARTAYAILDRSFNYVPYKTGELMASGTVGSASEFGDNDPFGGRVPVDSLSSRGSGEWNDRDLTAGMTGDKILGTVTMKSGVATRTFNRYWCGYTAHHAAVVHENPYSWEFKQGKGPRPQHKKQDHFLLKAYRELEPFFSAAQAAALSAILTAINARAEAQKRAMMGALSAGTGRPRLVKPGGR